MGKRSGKLSSYSIIDHFNGCAVLQPVIALPVGSVRDFEVVTQPLATVNTVTATVRASTTVRPGLDITFWVEDTVWNSQQLNGLNLRPF